MKKFLTLAILSAAMLGLAACAHHEEQTTAQTSAASTGYKK